VLPLVQAFFQMVLVDNLVHGDLHPGNILVRPAQPTPPVAAASAQSQVTTHLV
jgi:aarF domain-containing kinase